MEKEFRLLPEQASSVAGQVDLLTLFMVIVSILFAFLIFFLIYVFAVRYRRRSEDEIPRQIAGLFQLELVWSIIPFGLLMIAFVWGAKLYFEVYTPPEKAMEVYVVGKQWMWHIQHPSGVREINELHIPVNRPIKLTMATEDVIHSFYIPAFRIKRDVVPGRFTNMWFEATRIGEYHLFCAEYCGTKHSEMIGRVVVMDQADYQEWLSGGETGVSLAEAGEKRFQQTGCITCHAAKPGARGPSLNGLFGSQVVLESGEVVLADDSYIRESILNPRAKIVAGYKPLMPTYQGQISEQGLLELGAYIKSIGTNGSQQ